MKKFLLSLMLAVLALPALAESQAYFPGGNNALIAFLMREMRYPADAAENGIEGKVLVKFTVTPTGEIKNPEIVRPVDPSLEQEAIRVVLAMPAWVPATDDSGKNVETTVSLPVNFRLPKD